MLSEHTMIINATLNILAQIQDYSLSVMHSGIFTTCTMFSIVKETTSFIMETTHLILSYHHSLHTCVQVLNQFIFGLY